MVLGVLLRERQGGREVEYFATDVHGIIGREVSCGMGHRYPDSSPWRLWDFDVDEPNVLFPFRELIGVLLWIALLTRPDIANSERSVARYCSAPKLIHWKVARSILGYAMGTSWFRICF